MLQVEGIAMPWKINEYCKELSVYDNAKAHKNNINGNGNLLMNTEKRLFANRNKNK